MTSGDLRPHAPEQALTWAAAEDLQGLAPDLGWAEATALADALVDALAHRCVDVASGRDEPSTLPLVVGALGGHDAPVDHASCRAAAARLRAATRLLGQGGHGAHGWAGTAAEVAGDLADLLDQLADRARAGRIRLTDKGVVLRRLHALQRRLR